MGPEGRPVSTETGWLSQSTYDGLPARFQAAARELARRGEIVIGDQYARTSQNSRGSHGAAVLG